MEFSTWLLYISVIGILIFSPGPSALLCISHGLKFGNRRTIPTILGGAIAALLLMSISAIGLGAILAASETLFFILKIAGACYLVYLGWMSWKEGSIQIESNVIDVQNMDKNNGQHYSFTGLFRKGFMVGISNPKDLLFFIALFPSFMNAALPQMEQYMVLASTWFVFDCTSMFMYAGIGSQISPWLSKARTMRLVNRSIGSLFIVLGSALAISTGIIHKN